MPSNYATAYAESMALLQAALSASDDYKDLPVEWPNVEPTRTNDQDKPTENPKPWIRVQWQHGTGRQKTIGSANGKRRYEFKGLITISHFFTSGKGIAGIGAFSEYAYDAFLGKTTASGVTYLPHSPKDVQQNGLWYRSDAMIEFRYDEIK